MNKGVSQKYSKRSAIDKESIKEKKNRASVGLKFTIARTQVG